MENALAQQLEAVTLFRSPYNIETYDFPYNPDSLSEYNRYRIYDEMRNDDQVKAAIAIKKNLVISSGWKVNTHNTEVQEFVTKNLANINQKPGYFGTFENVVYDILSAYEYGFSLSEVVYELVEGKYYLDTIQTRSPHGFLFDVDDFGKLTKIRQISSKGEVKVEPNRLFHYVYQMEFGNPFGKSDLKSAHPSWVAKKFVQKFFNIYLERFASPTTVGKYKNLSTEEVSRFQSVLRSIQNSTSIAVPEDTNIEFISPARDSTDSYSKAIDKYNMQIARSILVPDLLGLGGAETVSGSYALGREQFNLFMGTIKKDRQSLSREITKAIIQPLVKINFGEDAAEDVEFEFVEFTNENVMEGARLWADAVKAGITKASIDDENYFRKLVGFPEAQEEAEGTDKEEQPPQQEQEDEPEPEEKKESFSVPARRKMTTYEKKMDFPRISKEMRKLENTVIQAVEPAALEIAADLLTQFKDREVFKRFDPEAINSIQPRFMKGLHNAFKKAFKGIYKTAADTAQDEIRPKEYAKKTIDPEWVPEEFLEILDAETFKMVGDYSTGLTKEMKNTAYNAVKSATGESAAVSAMRDVSANFSEKWIKTVVRTKTTEIYNSARRSFWENDEVAKKLVVAYQFSALIDESTSDICESLDGNVYELEDAIDRVTPPLHFNCRSQLVPITIFEEYEAEKVPSVEEIQEDGGGLKEFVGAGSRTK